MRWLVTGAALCTLSACNVSSFESLGTVPTPPMRQSEAGAPDAAQSGESVDAGSASSPLDAGPARPGAAGAAAGSGSAHALPASAGRGGAGGDPAPLSGTIGTMSFSVQSAFVSGDTENFGQIALYLFDANVSCLDISAFAWSSLLPGSVQMIEVLFSDGSAVDRPLTDIDVSYLRGGMYSFSKMRASASTLLLSSFTTRGDVDGTLMAMFGSTNSLQGLFHAEYCATGRAL